MENSSMSDIIALSPPDIDGYRILSGQMVLIKPREVYEDETGFGSMTQGRAYEENY